LREDLELNAFVAWSLEVQLIGRPVADQSNQVLIIDLIGDRGSSLFERITFISQRDQKGFTARIVG
jgi:hypothetical protein